MRIWIDIGPLFAYRRLGLRPTGIQRASMELARALHGAAPEAVRFARLDVAAGAVRPVPSDGAASLFDWLTSVRNDMVRLRVRRGVEPVEMPREPVRPGWLARLARDHLHPSFTRPLREASAAQAAALRHAGQALAALPSALWAIWQDQGEAGAASAALTGETPGAGDVLLTLGSAWSDPGHAAALAALRARHGVRHALLVHDIIPLMLPECFEERLTEAFERFMRASLPAADFLFAVSRTTARDVVTWATREGLVLAAAPEVVPLGAGLDPALQGELPDGLAPGGYALFVSTIEARKNHGLALRAWRRLLAEMPCSSVPTLVFAGREGWLVSDLMRQLRASRHLGGKVVLVEGADDGTLAALYRGALFTIYPSLYEGWGLPVTESLAFGKVCVASSAPAVQEAGGEFCLYHDPDSVSEAVALYREMLQRPDLRSSLEERLRRDYRPPGWSDGARVLARALGVLSNAGAAGMGQRATTALDMAAR